MLRNLTDQKRIWDDEDHECKWLIKGRDPDRSPFQYRNKYRFPGISISDDGQIDEIPLDCKDCKAQGVKDGDCAENNASIQMSSLIGP